MKLTRSHSSAWPLGVFLTLGLLWPLRGESEEREFCKHDPCALETLYVRFGDPARESSVLEGAVSGDIIEASVVTDVLEEGIAGWSFGVEHDESRLEILAAESTIRDDLGIEPIFETNSTRAVRGSVRGMVSSVITLLPLESGAIGQTLPVGPRRVLVRMQYRLRVDLKAGETTLLSFTEELFPSEGMAPPVKVALVVEREQRAPIRVLDGRISGPPVDGAGPFSRGDVNGDGRHNITDVIASTRTLFLGVPPRFDCRAAHDVNRDGSLDTSDAVYLLAWLFLGGDSIPRPFRDCGVSREESFECNQPTCDPGVG